AGHGLAAHWVGLAPAAHRCLGCCAAPAHASAGCGRLVLRSPGPVVLRGRPHHLDDCRCAHLSAWRALPESARSLLRPAVSLLLRRLDPRPRGWPLAATHGDPGRWAVVDECHPRPLVVLRVAADHPASGRIVAGQALQYGLSIWRPCPLLRPRHGAGPP